MSIAPDKSPEQHSMIAAINELIAQKDQEIADLRAALARPSPAPVKSVGEDAREEFEAHMKSVFGADEDFSRNTVGQYSKPSWQDAYVGWLERDSLLAARTVADAPAEKQHIPGNFTTHRTAWRDAITECINHELNAHEPDRAAYWEHELAAYDRSFARLLDNPEPVRSAAPVAADQPAHDMSVRDRALEEAARACETIEITTTVDADAFGSRIRAAYPMPAKYAAAIRALRSQPAKKGPAQ